MLEFSRLRDYLLPRRSLGTWEQEGDDLFSVDLLVALCCVVDIRG